MKIIINITDNALNFFIMIYIVVYNFNYVAPLYIIKFFLTKFQSPLPK